MFDGITVHSLIKNECRWIWYSLMSVIDNPDIKEIMVYDTGSTDETVDIVKSIDSTKIKLKEVGDVSAEDFSKLRHEMMEKTKTQWLMILDGDEIWRKKDLAVVIDRIKEAPENVVASLVHYMEFVKDIYHYFMGHEQQIYPYNIKKTYGWYTIRFHKKVKGLYCGNSYGLEGWFIDKKEVQASGYSNLIWNDDIYYFHTRNLLRSKTEDYENKVMQRVEKKISHKVGKIPRVYRNIEMYYPETFYMKHPTIVPNILWG